MFKWLKDVFFPEPEAPASGKRARGPKGRFKADDKSTPDINEAYADGKTPKRKKAAPKSAPKKRGRPKGSKNKVK